jgi:hypothetical protein
VALQRVGRHIERERVYPQSQSSHCKVSRSDVTAFFVSAALSCFSVLRASAAFFIGFAYTSPACVLRLNGARPMTFKSPSTPSHLNPMQWQQALAVSREACAGVFRDGGTPKDALASFGHASANDVNWDKAVDIIAEEICAHPMAHAA